MDEFFVDAMGDQRWYRDGYRHRSDGPAVIRADGTELWYWQDNEISMQHHPFVQALHRYDLYSKWERNELTDDERTIIKLSI